MHCSSFTTHHGHHHNDASDKEDDDKSGLEILLIISTDTTITQKGARKSEIQIQQTARTWCQVAGIVGSDISMDEEPLV